MLQLQLSRSCTVYDWFSKTLSIHTLGFSNISGSWWIAGGYRATRSPSRIKNSLSELTALNHVSLVMYRTMKTPLETLLVSWTTESIKRNRKSKLNITYHENPLMYVIYMVGNNEGMLGKCTNKPSQCFKIFCPEFYKYRPISKLVF